MRIRTLITFLPGLNGDSPVPARVLFPLMVVFILNLSACNGEKLSEPVLLKAITDVPVVSNEPIDIPLPNASTPVLVEILGSEAKLDSQLILDTSEVISRVRFEFLRSVPMFHYLDSTVAVDTPRLHIVPIQVPAKARLSVNIYSLPDPRGNNRKLTEAWQEMARGQQFVETMDPQAWAPNLSALESARSRFERLSLDEIGLWAAYLESFYLYFPVYRYAEAYGGAHDLLEIIDIMQGNGISSDRLNTLELLAHQLAGQILLEFDARSNQHDEQSQFEAARHHFNAARSLAETAGLQFEETWAINNLGISYFYEDELDLAFEHYALALQQSESAQDSYLIALIGSNMAVEQQRRGNINEAVQILQRIEHAPSMRNNPLEREHVLGLLGHYYMKLYRFPEALKALNEALYLSELLESSESRGRNRIKLGRAYREMGQIEKARVLVQKALRDLEGVQDQRELKKAHRLLANLHRSAGDYEAMQRDRYLEAESLQTERDRDRADWLFSRAEDALAQNLESQAVEGFRESAAIYDEVGFGAWSDFATLRACAAGISLKQTARCSSEQLRPRYERIRQIQASAPALQARFDWIRLLTSKGQQLAAISEAKALVDEIQFYRQALPGILGAWYWDARGDVFKHFLQLALNMPGLAGSSHPDALLILDRLRNSAGSTYVNEETAALADAKPIATTYSPSEVGLGGDSSSIRALLALRDQAGTPEEAVQAQRLIDSELIKRRQRAREEPGIGSDDFLSQLRELPDDWSVVSYYLAGPIALAWVGNHTGLQLFELGPSDAIRELIDRVRSGLTVFNAQSLESDLRDLSDVLISPIRAQLRFNIMVASGGALNDLPLEVLPIEGRPLIETHQLMHIQSIANPALSISRAVSDINPLQLFLAGDPGNGETSRSDLPGTQRELDAISEIFPAAESVIYSQDILDTEVFRGDTFRSADLIHLASHALIDREYPELSRLILSQGKDEEPTYLAPADIDGIPLAASLIVLSACETVGHNGFEFDSRMGFVTQLVHQSDALVIASLWPVSDRATSEFMQAFYQLLAVSGNVPEALRATKLLYRRMADSEIRSWAAFQLFTR